MFRSGEMGAFRRGTVCPLGGEDILSARSEEAPAPGHREGALGAHTGQLDTGITTTYFNVSVMSGWWWRGFDSHPA